MYAEEGRQHLVLAFNLPRYNLSHDWGKLSGGLEYAVDQKRGKENMARTFKHSFFLSPGSLAGWSCRVRCSAPSLVVSPRAHPE